MLLSTSAADQCCPLFQTDWQISHWFATEESYSAVLNSTLENRLAQDRALWQLLASVVSVHQPNVTSLIPNTCNFLSAAGMIEIILYCVLHEVECCKLSSDCINHMGKWFIVPCLKDVISWLVRSLLELSMVQCLNERPYWVGFCWGLSWVMY